MMNLKLVFGFLFFTALVFASSHSEAPGTASAPAADVTDFYMFQCYEPGREDYTCFMMNARPLQNAFAGPNYFTLSDDHFFEIYIDNDGDSDEDDCVIYQRGAAPPPLTHETWWYCFKYWWS